MSELIRIERDHQVAKVILCAPQRLNVVGKEFLEQLEAIQKDLFFWDDMKAVAVMAEGKHFSAGMDLNYLQTASPAVMKRILTSYQDIYGFWEKLPVPVIAGIQGKCIGSGVELILGCDIRIATTQAQFSLPEVKIGLSPDMGGTTRLTKLVGNGQAKLLILGCEEIGAEEALRIGLVEKIVEPEALSDEVMNMAHRIAHYPTSGVRFAKRGIAVAQESSLRASLYYEEAQSIYCTGTADIHESLAAMLEKRKPEYKGE